MKFLGGKFPSRPPLARTNDDGAHRVLRPKEDNDDDADDPVDAMDITAAVDIVPSSSIARSAAAAVARPLPSEGEW